MYSNVNTRTSVQAGRRLIHEDVAALGSTALFGRKGRREFTATCLLVVRAEASAGDRFARCIGGAAIGEGGRSANERALGGLGGSRSLEHTLWLGGGASRDVLGTLPEELAFGRAERALESGDLDRGLALHAWTSVGVLVVGGAGRSGKRSKRRIAEFILHRRRASSLRQRFGVVFGAREACGTLAFDASALLLDHRTADCVRWAWWG